MLSSRNLAPHFVRRDAFITSFRAAFWVSWRSHHVISHRILGVVALWSCHFAPHDVFVRALPRNALPCCVDSSYDVSTWHGKQSTSLPQGRRYCWFLPLILNPNAWQACRRLQRKQDKKRTLFWLLRLEIFAIAEPFRFELLGVLSFLLLDLLLVLSDQVRKSRKHNARRKDAQGNRCCIASDVCDENPAESTKTKRYAKLTFKHSLWHFCLYICVIFTNAMGNLRSFCCSHKKKRSRALCSKQLSNRADLNAAQNSTN